MRLREFSITNFRSITGISKISFGNLTVLLGPNNEGKSNVLRALAITLGIALGRRTFRRRRRGFRLDDTYQWERDFPVSLQSKRGKALSEFSLCFDLSAPEQEALRGLIKGRSKNTSSLFITVKCGRDSYPEVVFKHTNRSKTALKNSPITEFLGSRLDLTYIPAIRTADEAETVVSLLIDRELERLESNTDFSAAIARVRELQQPILDEVADAISGTLRQFLPAINSVRIEPPKDGSVVEALRGEILVDDGSLTELKYKGDGVQSLATLALLKYAAEREGDEKDQAPERQSREVLLALEEPESHLHPLAIHELVAVIRKISESQQVILTTHCPLFVDRQNLASNILVRRGKAQAARHIDEVREILGVKPSDNLIHAELVLVVEGEDDRIALGSILRTRSDVLDIALRNNRLAIDTLNGATNLSYKLGLLRTALCRYTCFLDDDLAGRRAVEDAKSQKLLEDSQVTYAKFPGRSESEFEDLIRAPIIQGVLERDFGITVFSIPERLRRGKWSSRMKQTFVQAGKQWSDIVQMQLKMKVALAVAESRDDVTHDVAKPLFDNFVDNLVTRLTPRTQSKAGMQP